MKWIFEYVDKHKGDYWFKCSKCGNTDWFAGYTDPNKHKIPCGECNEVPEEA